MLEGYMGVAIVKRRGDLIPTRAFVEHVLFVLRV